MREQPKWILAFTEVSRTGSRVICDPAPTDTDEDWVAFDPKGKGSTHLIGLGFREEGRPGFYTGNDAGKFRSFRLGDVNVVVTPEREFYDLFVSATELARRFNLTVKADRIALFQVVLYGVSAQSLEVAA